MRKIYIASGKGKKLREKILKTKQIVYTLYRGIMY